MTEKDRKQPGWLALVLLEAVTLGLGVGVGLYIREDVSVYATLAKPAFAPPSWVFPVVWTLLYAAMALSAWLYLRSGAQGRTAFLVLYGVQLLVNLLWPILFFTLQAFGLSFLWLLLLLVLVAVLTRLGFRASKPAGWLLVPYGLWVLFAGVLNFAVAVMNR